MMSKERYLAAAVPLAAVLYPDTSQPAAGGGGSHGQYGEGLGAPVETPRRAGALARLRCGLAAWVAAWREHRAVS